MFRLAPSSGSFFIWQEKIIWKYSEPSSRRFCKIKCEMGPQVTAPIWAPSGTESGHEQRNLVLRWETCLLSSGKLSVMWIASAILRSLRFQMLGSRTLKCCWRNLFSISLLGQCKCSREKSRLNFRRSDLNLGHELMWSWTLNFLLGVLCSEILVLRLLLDSPIYSESHGHKNEYIELVVSSVGFVGFIVGRIEKFKRIVEKTIRISYSGRNFFTVRIICFAIFEHLNEV